MRTSWVIQRRKAATRRLEAAITTAVASPIPRPLVAVLVMAMVGHIPNSMTRTPLLSQSPSRAMVP